MIIYVDLVLLLNFFLDFLLLLGVCIVLKRNVKIWRIVLASFLGSLSVLFLFININSITLFVLKFIVSIIMVLVGFGFNCFKYFINNIIYLYMIGVVLGGFLDYLNNIFSFRSEGLVFVNNGFSINYLFLLLVSPIIIYFYVKTSKELKNNYSNYFKCEILFNDKSFVKVTSFLDTGNKLKDPYSNRGIILLNKKFLPNGIRSPILVPYHTLNNNGLLKCYKGLSIKIDNKVNNNILVGVSEDKIFIDGIDCIISNTILEGLK